MSASTTSNTPTTNLFEKPAQRCISAVFQTQEQVSEVIRRLLNRKALV